MVNDPTPEQENNDANLTIQVGGTSIRMNGVEWDLLTPEQSEKLQNLALEVENYRRSIIELPAAKPLESELSKEKRVERPRWLTLDYKLAANFIRDLTENAELTYNQESFFMCIAKILELQNAVFSVTSARNPESTTLVQDASLQIIIGDSGILSFLEDIITSIDIDPTEQEILLDRIDKAYATAKDTDRFIKNGSSTASHLFFQLHNQNVHNSLIGSIFNSSWLNSVNPDIDMKMVGSKFEKYKPHTFYFGKLFENAFYYLLEIYDSFSYYTPDEGLHSVNQSRAKMLPSNSEL